MIYTMYIYIYTYYDITIITPYEMILYYILSYYIRDRGARAL